MKIHIIAALLFCAGLNSPGQTKITPLTQAHAHNDYEHRRPLADALDQGICSVEADVWLVNGNLLVAHDLKDARTERTLQRLYLDPLQQRVRENNGRVFPGGPGMLLLIDVKSDATNTYAAIKAALEPYRSILTIFRSASTATNAVSVVISGNRAREWMMAEPERLAAYDGRLADLPSNPSPHFMPLVSDNWVQHFRWKGIGKMEPDDMTKLNSIVQRVHERGQSIRFWGMPDSPAVWKALRDANVDLINTDDLSGLARFLRASEGKVN